LFGFGDPLISDNNIIFEGFFSPTFLGGIFTPTSFVAGAGDTIDGKTLNSVINPVISDNGDIVFQGSFPGGDGIFTPTSCVVCIGDTIDGRTLLGIGVPAINDNGDIVFSGVFFDDPDFKFGIFTPTSCVACQGLVWFRRPTN